MALEKQLNILDYALHSLYRRRLKIIGVILVFAAVIFLLASFQMTSGALTTAAERLLDGAPEITIQHLRAGRQETIALSAMDKLDRIFGIRAVVPRVWGYYFDATTGANYTVLGIDPQLMPQGDRLATAIDGRLPKEHEAVAGPGVLKKLALGGRHVFSLYRPDLSLKSLTIAGVFARDTAMVTDDTLFMPPADARDLFALRPDEATDLCVYVANPKEVDTIAAKIAEALPGTRVLTRAQIAKTYRAVFGWRSGFASICLLTALSAFIIFAWDKASGLTPEEKKEIAILKVLGWQTADILTARMYEGAVVSLVSFLIGYSLAYAHVGYFAAGLFRPILMGWSALTPSITLVPRLAVGDVMLTLCLTVLPYLAATIIPAWRGSIIPPDSAMN